MIVKPVRRTWWDGSVVTIPSSIADGLFIECEVVNPPSAKGRKVTVWVDNDAADAMLFCLRDHARDRRALNNGVKR